MKNILQKIEATGLLRKAKETRAFNGEKRKERCVGFISYLKMKLKCVAISLAFVVVLPMAGAEQYLPQVAPLSFSPIALIQASQTRAANSQNTGHLVAPITLPTKSTSPSTESAESDASQRIFKLSDTVKTDKGRVTVSWEDSGNNLPYKVSYRYAGTGALSNNWFWAGQDEPSSTTIKKSFVIEHLIPGEKYELKVEDCNGETISRNYTLSKAISFVDGDLKASDISVEIYPRQKMYGAEDSTATDIDALIANDIITNMMETQDKEYGFRYHIHFPELTYSRTYFEQVAITAPDGKVACETFDTRPLEAGWNGYYYHMTGEWTFEKIYKENASVPTGTWKVDLYWDGMHVNQSTFEVNSNNASMRVFQLDDTFEMDKGCVTVSWEDSENKSPYTVSYRYAGNNVLEKSSFLGHGDEQGSKTFKKSFTLEMLAPGNKYEILIEDCNGERITHYYTLPEAESFVDEDLKATHVSVEITPVKKEVGSNYSTASEINTLIAKEIISNMGKMDYGIRYEIYHPELRNSCTYYTQLFVTAPDGYTQAVKARDQDYEKGYYGFYMLGEDVFKYIYNETADIPIGTWEIDLYWDGMHVNKSTFEVQSSVSQRVFKLNDTVTIDKGRVTVSWEDSESSSPYQVSYRYAGVGAFEKSFFWGGGKEQESTTTQKSFVLEQLIPGKTYEIVIEDCNGITISCNYTLPEAVTFLDEDLKASSISIKTYPVQKEFGAAYSTTSEIDALIAKDIISNMGQIEYGVGYEAYYPKLRTPHTYFTQLFITAPTGYIEVDTHYDENYENGYLGYYMLGDGIFHNIYNEIADIPAGVWKVDLFWDGMHVNQSTFEVLKNTPIKPTATPTPKPTATPQRVFRLNSTVKTDKGRVTISWEDSENNYPYSVSYVYVGKSNAVQSRYEVSEGETYSKTITTGDLIPGKTYLIEVKDCNGTSISHTYSLPTPSTFVDGLLKASSIKVKIAPRQKNDSASDKTASSISALRAVDIIADIGEKEYGFRYSMDYPKLAHSRNYYTQIAITAPNDYLECELSENVEYGAKYSGRYYYMLGDWTFWRIYYENSSIPKGTWKVDLYWDGMHVNQSTFEVQ